MRTVAARTALGLLVMVAVAGCDEKKTNLAPAASSLAPAAAPAAGAKVKKFLIEPESRTSIEMEAPKEKIRATTTGGTGSLDVDLGSLERSRGEVKIDLSTIRTNTFTVEKDNEAQTMHARTWLEVGDAESAKLDDRTKEVNRYAVFAIRSIEKIEPAVTTLAKVPVTKDGADDIRSVTLSTRGELLVHGRKVDRDAEVEATFRYAPGADADRPKGLVIRTKKPLRVVLAEHDVKPRDGFGKIAKGSFHLLGTKVADNAEITVDLRAKPQSL